MRHTHPRSRTQRLTAFVAALFGLATIVSGGRILLGLADAGYAVVRPVLLFNSIMGVVYVIAAVVILRDVGRGRMLAVGIALVNAAVLLAIVARRASGGVVAEETLAAMTLRAGVWVAIAIALARELGRRRAPVGQA